MAVTWNTQVATVTWTAVDDPSVTWVVQVDATVTGGGGGGGGVELGETSTTAYRGDRGKTAYDHSQVTTGNPHGTTAADIGAAATSHTHTGTQVAVDASGFNGNLTTSDDTVQEIAQKLDDLVIPAAGIADPGGANDDILQRKAGVWTYRTPAQVKTDLGVVASPSLSSTPFAGSYMPTVQRFGGAGATMTHSVNVLYYTPMLLSYDASFDRVTCVVNVGSAGNTVRLGLYSAGATGRPATLVADWGTVTTDATGGKELTISASLTAGLYWVGSVSSAAISMGGWNPFWTISMTSLAGSGVTTGYSESFTYGALPSSATPATEVGRLLDCKMRVA